jgi:hypothetical protein
MQLKGQNAKQKALECKLIRPSLCILRRSRSSTHL